MTFEIWDPKTKRMHPTSSVRSADEQKGEFCNKQVPHPGEEEPEVIEGVQTQLQVAAKNETNNQPILLNDADRVLKVAADPTEPEEPNATSRNAPATSNAPDVMDNRNPARQP